MHCGVLKVVTVIGTAVLLSVAVPLLTVSGSAWCTLPVQDAVAPLATVARTS